MRILILTSRFPHPLEKGDKLRLFEQLKVLSDHFQVTLCAFSEDKVGRASIEALAPYCEDIHILRLGRRRFFTDFWLGLMKGMPAQVAYFYQRSKVRQVREIIEQVAPDVVYCQLIRTAPYVPADKKGKQFFLDYMDSFAFNWLGKGTWRHRFEQRRIARYETRVFDLFDAHFVISERDRNQFVPAVRGAIDLLPNGVDVDYWKPKPDVIAAFDISFCGNLAYGPNREALDFIEDLVRTDTAGMTAISGGAGAMPQYLDKSDEVFTVKGWTEDLRTVYQSGKIFVAPIFSGSGMQNKVLEAMAQGLPCIVTPFVDEAIKTPGGVAILANSMEEFREAIRALLDDDDLRADMGKKAREFVKKHYDWADNTAVLVEKIKLSSRS